MLGDERHGGDAGKLVDQMPDGFHLLRRAAMHREEHGVDRPLPHHPHRVGDRVAVHHGEAAVPGRVDPEPFSRQQHGGDGGGGESGGWHGILQVMVQEDGGETSNWVQPETPRTRRPAQPFSAVTHPTVTPGSVYC